MKDAASNSHSRLPWWARWQTWILGVVVCLAMYVLTAPFFIAMIVPGDAPSPEQIARLKAIYGPLIWLHENLKLFEIFYQWWKHVLGYD